VSYTEASPLYFGGEALFLVEGTLSELHIARTTVDLLKQIDSNTKAQNVAAGAAAVFGSMPGMVANPAATAPHDGEETYHFAGLLDGQVICGTFQHADKIREGDRVKAAVSKRSDVLFVHSILNTKTQEFYMPANAFVNSNTLFRHCVRTASRLTVWGWVALVGLALFGVFFDSEISGSEKLAVAVACLVLPPVIAFSYEFWDYRSLRRFWDEIGDSRGGAIFKVFGFAKPSKIDLLSYNDLSTGADGGWRGAWRVERWRGADPKPRVLPNVSADGMVTTEDDADYACGAIMSLRHGGTDVLSGYSAQYVLQASTPLPPRMLLAYAMQTLEDRKKGAQAEAFVHAVVASLPALLVMGLLRSMGASKEFTLFSFIVIMLGVMLRAFWNEIRDPEKAWRLTKWLDFETRTWNARRSFLDGNLPDHTASIPLAELALVCFVHQWEQGASYDVGLCKTTELKFCERSGPAILNVIHSADEESAAHDFGRALAALWGIDCWKELPGVGKYQKFQA
jgi:hypothetical protein